MGTHIRYKGKGEHSVNELEKIIEQREEELRLLKIGRDPEIKKIVDVLRSVYEPHHVKDYYKPFVENILNTYK